MKRWTIRGQLFAVIAAICLVVVVGQVIFTQLSFRAAFASYVEDLNMQRLEAIAGRLAENYDQTLGWELVANDRRLWGDIARTAPVSTERPIGGEGFAEPRSMGGPAYGPPPVGSLVNDAFSDEGTPRDRLQDVLGPRRQSVPFDEVFNPEPVGVEISRGILPPGVLPEGLRPGPPPMSQELLIGANTARGGGPELTLVDLDAGFVVGSTALLEEKDTLNIPVVVRDEIVGYLVSPGGMRIANELDDAFSQKLLQQSAWIGIAVAGLAIICAIVVAKQFSQPVVRLNEGTDQLMKGNYDYQMPIDGPLEFGLLEQKFNRLSKTLAANRKSQQHWISNISHELRTPLTVLQAELDALDAGIREFTRERLGSLTEEARRLGRLIDDLFLLSRADAGDLSYQFTKVDLKSLIQDLADGFQEKLRHADLRLEVSVPSRRVMLTADADRLRQLVGNLVNNSCAYSDAGGRVCIRLMADRVNTYIEVEDSSPGVEEAEREKIFDRLYRVEKSRNRSEGGSGLGLAICRAIAEAHGARIEAFDSKLGGLRVRVTFSRKAV